MNKTVVLVIDVQSELCTGNSATWNSMEVISNINSVILKARTADVKVIFVQHETELGDLKYGSKGWQLPEQLNALESDLYIRKSASDSFKNTSLQNELEHLEVDHLVVCGMQSEFCVDSTIRCALSLGYAITVISDGHTTTDNGVLTAESISKHHNVTWENLSSYGVRATPIKSAAISFDG